MPKKPLRKKGRIGRDSLTIGALEQLLLGYDPNFCKPLTDDELKAEYDRHRDFIMSLVGQNVRKLVPGWFLRPIPIPWGSRPACWWTWSAPEPRRIIAGDPAAAMPEHGYSFGRPKLYKSLGAYNAMVFESQPNYLRRHGLLMDGEAEKIKPELINR